MSYKILLKSAIIFIAVYSAGMPSSTLAQSKSENESKNIFVVYNSGDDRDAFRVFAKQMARLKPYGRVDIAINSPALKSDFEIPAGSCDWHEYASYDISVEAFFPDKRLIPYFPETFITKNRQLLIYKAGIIRESGLNAAIKSNEPRYLPEVFFEKYPELRGPRVDHPRRSVMKEFAPCFHQPGTLEIYRNMVDELFKNVPEIRTLYFSLNDAGSGFCWDDWLYSGPNGPSFCRQINKSAAIISMLNVYKEGARQTGHDVEIYFKGMLTDEEKNDLAGKLPENCFLEGRNYPAVKNISSMLDETYPVNSIINPMRIIRTLSRSVSGQGRYVLDFWTAYDRANDRIETVEKIVDIIEDNLLNPPGEGEMYILQALKKLCDKWAGASYSDQLFKAFVELDKSINENSTSLQGLSTLYWGVSTRQITRPLVFAPKLLTPEEEQYFLPHVFNISVEEARNDYMDIHGGNRELKMNATDRLVSSLRRVSEMLGKINEAPEQAFIDDMTNAIRLYSCVLRSCGNFNDAQIIRNRNKEMLAGPIHRPNKIPTWSGDQDLLDFNRIMRDELDNMQDMIEMLESGGMKLVCTSKQPFPEDTFILGPDLIAQLKLKRKIMLAHWTDIEGYLATPFK